MEVKAHGDNLEVRDLQSTQISEPERLDMVAIRLTLEGGLG